MLWAISSVAAGAHVLKVREVGRVISVHALVATSVPADGHPDSAMHVTSAEDGAGAAALFRHLTTSG